MDWGIYNDIYGDPWAITYAGQFWTEVDIGSHQTLRLSDRDVSVSPERPESHSLPGNQWIQAERALRELSNVLQLLRNLCQLFPAPERILIEFEASEIRDRWLQVHDSWISGPGKAPSFRRTTERTADELQSGWMDVFADFGKDFCDLFCRDGRTFSRQDITTFVNPAGR